MKYSFKSMAIALLVTVASMGSAKADGLSWGDNVNDALTEAKQENKLIMIDMYTDWCGWCKKLDSDVYTQSNVIEAAEPFIPLKLDAEKNGAGVARDYKVSSFPTILFFNSSGDLIDTIVGYQAADRFTASLQEIVTNYRAFPQLEEAVRKNPDDVASIVKFVPCLVKRNRVKDAAKLVSHLEEIDAASAVPLYNAVASAYSDQRDRNSALLWYKKTLAVATDTDTIVHTHIGLYNVYTDMKNQDKRIAELKAILNTPNVSDKDRDQASQMLINITAPDN